MSQTKAQLVDAVDGSIVAADLASNSVTTAKVADDAITIAKLSTTGTASSSTFLRGDGAFAEAGGGKVLAYQNVVKTDTSTTQNTSFTDISGLSVTMTPASAASRFRVDYHVNFGVSPSVYSGSLRLVKVVGGSTTDNIYIGDAAGSRRRTSNFTWSSNAGYGSYPMAVFSGSLIHHPNTTSAVTFKLQFQSHYSGGFTVYVNRNQNDSDNTNHARGASSITMVELAA